MKAGIQIELSNAKKVLSYTEFSKVEIKYDADAFKSFEPNESFNGSVTGVSISMEELNRNTLLSCIQFLRQCKGAYLVVSTMDAEEITDEFRQLLVNCCAKAAECGIFILVENGCKKQSEDFYCNTAFSGAEGLQELLDDVKKKLPEANIGICFNTGIANLTGRNMRALVEDMGNSIRLIHANDNDGMHDLRQLPYSFTTGRGRKSTDWTRFVGQLIRQNYDSYLVFDTAGLFACAPESLHPVFCRLLYGIYQEWESRFYFEKKLQKEKQGFILFGAGQMAGHYIQKWGEKYPPVCLSDNNKALWGEKVYGYDVIAPVKLLEKPYCDYRVMICNQYYTQVRGQLDEMGIAYDCYYDEYDF